MAVKSQKAACPSLVFIRALDGSEFRESVADKTASFNQFRALPIGNVDFDCLGLWRRNYGGLNQQSPNRQSAVSHGQYRPHADCVTLPPLSSSHFRRHFPVDLC